MGTKQQHFTYLYTRNDKKLKHLTVKVTTPQVLCKGLKEIRGESLMTFAPYFIV